jgi:ADP-heptose:LPS heptosyltransferase
MKKVLVVRLGAYGDMIIISPVLTRLKELGYYVILNTNQRGIDLYENDKRIDEIIPHDESIPVDKVQDHWDEQKKEIAHDLYINFTSSIENNLALHPTQPLYTKPKQTRMLRCNRNYYEETAKLSGLEGVGFIPSVVFSEEEENYAKSIIRPGSFNIVWGLSGSGTNKVYPWAEFVMGSLIKEYPNIHIITLGDEKCKILENINKQLPEKNFTELAGEIPIRKAFALTKFANLVIAPDTGLLHSAGCWETPKIGLLGHTSIENITKHFKNDYSIEANCSCAPCFFLIYDYRIQCPIDPITRASWCMSSIEPERVFEQVKRVMVKHG